MRNQDTAPARPNKPTLKRVVFVLCAAGIAGTVGYVWGWQAWVGLAVGTAMGVLCGYILGHDMGYALGLRVQYGRWVERGSV